MKLIRTLQKTNKDQYILTIPKTLVQLLNWENKDKIEFGFERGKITITCTENQKFSEKQKTKGFPAKATGKRGEKR
ncbi:hypothetical protein KY314_01100 [Candidatus Woesearchaeota archaeon]|nr:hypothetical protein [Candidatus Woesearchaeota archaeon]